MQRAGLFSNPQPVAGPTRSSPHAPRLPWGLGECEGKRYLRRSACGGAAWRLPRVLTVAVVIRVGPDCSALPTGLDDVGDE